MLSQEEKERIRKALKEGKMVVIKPMNDSKVKITSPSRKGVVVIYRR